MVHSVLLSVASLQGAGAEMSWQPNFARMPPLSYGSRQSFAERDGRSRKWLFSAPSFLVRIPISNRLSACSMRHWWLLVALDPHYVGESIGIWKASYPKSSGIRLQNRSGPMATRLHENTWLRTMNFGPHTTKSSMPSRLTITIQRCRKKFPFVPK